MNCAPRFATEKAEIRPALARIFSVGASTEEASMSEFWEKYKDPRWQKRRLEMMNFYSFKCGHCGSADKTLNVHHRIYRKGKNPWEYEDHELQCLCEDCHERSHALHKSVKECLVMLDDAVVAVVLGYVQSCMATDYPDGAMYVHNLETATGVADYCHVSVDTLSKHIDATGRITGKQMMRLHDFTLERERIVHEHQPSFL